MARRDPNQSLHDSWEFNAAAWTTAVREHLIPSRKAGTNAAILEACLQFQPKRVLDVGCGEGWLARALADAGCEVVGIDASAALIELARASGGGHLEVISYEALSDEPSLVPGPWDLIVCNFALLGDPLAPLLSALGKRLGPHGRLLIQTVPPWIAKGDGPYIDGWREETFAGWDVEFPAAMPWYFRTLGSWVKEITAAGLTIKKIEEPLSSETKQPLSVIFECGKSQ